MLTGCVAAQPIFAPPTTDTVTVFVHGYKGSFLDTAGEPHRRAWLNVGDVFFAGEESLALAWEGQRSPVSFPALVPAGPVTKLTAVPLIVSEDIYLGWLEFGRDHLPGFIPFAYDWRQDVVASGERLCEFLDKLPATKLRIVAHSMGGLVTWSCLSQHENVAARVTKIVFAGTPFQGGPGIFDDLLYGTPTGRNKALLSRDALFSFPSAWQLLPTHSSFFVDRAGAPVGLDAFDPEVWVKRRWGIFDGPTTPADLAQLRRQLAHPAALHDLLARPLLSKPEVLAVIGTGRATVCAVRVLGEAFDFNDPPTCDGDGSVLLPSAAPPQPFVQFNTGADHVQLLNDASVQRAVEAFLAL